MTVTNRSTKGSALTYEEMDANLAHLNTLLTEYNNYEIDQWYLQGNWRVPTSSTQGKIGTNNQSAGATWSRLAYGGADKTKIGTGMAQRIYNGQTSSGTFIFPRMGLWQITARVNIELKGASNVHVKMIIIDDQDNSKGYGLLRAGMEEHSPTNDVTTTVSGSFLVNIDTPPDNDTWRFYMNGVYFRHPIHNGQYHYPEVLGGTTYGAETYLIFERKGPHQT